MPNAQKTVQQCVMLVGLLWLARPGHAQDVDTLIQQATGWTKQATELIEQGRYRQAEQLLQGLIWEFERGNNVVLTTSALTFLASVHERTGRYDEGERIAQRGVDLARRHRNEDALAAPLVILGNIHRSQRRFNEAEAEIRQVVAANERKYGTNSSVYAESLENLAIVLNDTGRFQDAEPLLQRALAIRYRKNGPKSYSVAQSYCNLGILYHQHDRLDDAYAFLRQALKIWEEVSGRDSIVLQYPLVNLIQVCNDGRRWDEAKAYHQRLKQVLLKEYTAEQIVGADAILADILLGQKKYAEAEPLYRRYQEFLLHQANRDGEAIAANQSALAEICFGLGRYAEAEELVSQSLATLDPLEAMTSARCSAYSLRGRIHYEQQKLDQAIADLRESVRLAEDIRSRLSGSDQERARSFGASLRDKYMLLFRILLKKGDLPAALAVADQGRARSLFDQMHTAHADLLAGLPTSQAHALRQELNKAEAQVAQLERQLGATEADAGISQRERQSQEQQLRQALVAARRQLVVAHTAIRNASPLYRKALAKDFQPVSLSEMDAWLAERKSCLLYYMLDNDTAMVVSRGRQASEQVAQVLKASADQAKVLGIEAGPLNGEILEKVLHGKQGVLPLLARADTSNQAQARLAVLWKVLIPAEIRVPLLKGEYEGLMIVPDGALGLLPFETLIVETGEDPKYLLDVAPPIAYAPSMTLLHTLAGRSAAKPNPSAAQPLLTLGDPLYGGTGEDSAQARSAGLRTRYGALGGKLARLPNTLAESHWVQQALRPVGWSAVQLIGPQATEAAVRSNIQGRTIVHLACHALADQAYGNFFGALALTPGSRGNSAASNDGFLTLAEVCELDLRGNELTMLSACQTNYGPQQQGEGVWALTRGFLVAGSRRVMASNWVVDDEAAATLVYYFALNIAEGQKSGQLDYAQALHKAKQAVRKQTKWQNPYFWGTFVLVGPN